MRDRGVLRCGVLAGPDTLAVRDEGGVWQGFDVELCRGVAVLALRNAEALEVVPVGPDAGLARLAAGEVDVIARFPAGRHGQDQVAFTTLTLVDGLALLVPAEGGPANLLDTKESVICFSSDEGQAAALTNLSERQGLAWQLRGFEDQEALLGDFASGACAALAGPRIALAALSGLRRPGRILPDALTRDQSGPFVRRDDPTWSKLVTWMVFALIQAEELGLTKATVAQVAAETADPATRRFLGLESDLGRSLGIAPDWTQNLIAALGNYGEVYDRTLGTSSDLGLDRGPNSLWRDGGLLHAIPFL